MKNLFMITIGTANYFVRCTEDELAAWTDMVLVDLPDGVNFSATKMTLSDFDSINHDQFC